MTQRILVCGDPHGHPECLRAALARASYDPANDKLILLGDYLDRGPEPWETVDLVMELVAGGAVALKGNHEDMFLKFIQRQWPRENYLYQNKGLVTYHQYRDFPINQQQLYVNFLKRLPLYHEGEEHIFVHAGVRPGVPLDKNSPFDLLWIRDVFLEGYRGKKVIFGHTPFPDVYWGEDKIGIDTDLAYGGKLTILELNSREVYQVSCTGEGRKKERRLSQGG